MPSSIVGSVAGSLASTALSSVLGGKKSKSSSGIVDIPSINSGGILTKLDKNGRLVAIPSSQRQSLISSLKGLSERQAGEAAGYIPKISEMYDPAIAKTAESLAGLSPGYGDITAARLSEIENQRAATESDLRSSLARRRVLGSSFSNDVISRANAEFAQKKAESRAASFLEELDTKTKLVEQQLKYETSKLNDIKSLTDEAFSYRKAATQTDIDELNFQLGVAKGILELVASAQRANADVSRQNALSAGQAVGAITGPLGQKIGTGVTNMVDALRFSSRGSAGNMGSIIPNSFAGMFA